MLKFLYKKNSKHSIEAILSIVEKDLKLIIFGLEIIEIVSILLLRILSIIKDSL